jgi:hypothetical protein
MGRSMLRPYTIVPFVAEFFGSSFFFNLLFFNSLNFRGSLPYYFQIRLAAELGEQVEEFVGGDGGGAEFANDDAGGGVGEARGVGEWRASGGG